MSEELRTKNEEMKLIELIKKLISDKHVLLLARLILGFVFIYAASEKITDPVGFAESIHNYKIFPLITINLISIILPWLELITGLFLIFGISVKESVFIINILTFLFIILIGVSLFRGLNIDCGCFGTNNGETIGVKKIIEDVILLLLGILIYFYDKEYFSIIKLKQTR
jgi:putative oxidoreductase